MFTALTKDNKRISIEEAISGETYYCPVCGNPVAVKAANSNNVRTHFAHKRNSLCFDDWKHDMSDWHFEWQSKFPIESREVVVEKDGVVHRADILINDTVIEFQHSPISGEEFESRNRFYKNCGYRVVWLFDATDKMKVDEAFGLVWRRKTTLFSSMRTPIDAFYVQHYLPDKDDLLIILKLDPKEVCHYKTEDPIMPENFLKEYGGIQDENVPSIQTIIRITQITEARKKCDEVMARAKQFSQPRVFIRPGKRRYRRF
jgi:competence CoiA-like predicted nuclease